MTSGEKVIAGITFGLGILPTAGLAELTLGACWRRRPLASG